MISYIKINGFKSFQSFEMAFTPLTVVAGANASGKSNLFDVLQLLSRLAETDLKTAFSEQRGGLMGLFTKYTENSYAPEIDFTVKLLLNRNIKDNWGGKAELNNTRLRYRLIIARRPNESGIDRLVIKWESLEEIKPKTDKFIEHIPKSFWEIKKTDGSKAPFIKTVEENGITTIKIRRDGGKQIGKTILAKDMSQTVLCGINSVDFPHIFAVKEEIRTWKILQLDPKELREPSNQDLGLQDTVTSSGKNLAAALYGIKQADKYSLKEISRRLNSFLPNFVEVNIYDDKVKCQYIIKLKSEEGKELSSDVLSGGTLRLLGLCILKHDYDCKRLLCFEEPEDSIHPLCIKELASLLEDLCINFADEGGPLRQVLVNTHSALLVSHLLKRQIDSNGSKVSVWLSRLDSLISNYENEKIKIKITKICPVFKKNEPNQLFQSFVSESERKYTVAEVIKYLGTVDTYDSIKAIH